jgi:hypothetical protein
LTVRGGAPIAVDKTKRGGVFLSRIADMAMLIVANNTVEFFSKLGRLVRQVLRAVLFPAESLMLGPLLILSKQRRAAFAMAPLARGERKPRQSIQGLVG